MTELLFKLSIGLLGGLLVGYQILFGVARLGLTFRVRRSERPAQFWFVIAIQVFVFVMLMIAALAMDTGYYR